MKLAGVEGRVDAIHPRLCGARDSGLAAGLDASRAEVISLRIVTFGPVGTSLKVAAGSAFLKTAIMSSMGPCCSTSSEPSGARQVSGMPVTAGLI